MPSLFLPEDSLTVLEINKTTDSHKSPDIRLVFQVNCSLDFQENLSWEPLFPTEDGCLPALLPGINGGSQITNYAVTEQ